ncbi:MAG: hypothetical protein HQK87_00625 [Nitrospinae bacterium]|nr:hypothetical protein [Nitrospinota bacterium]
MNRRQLLRGAALLTAGLALPRCGGSSGDSFNPDAPFDHSIAVGPAERVGAAIDGFHFPHFAWDGPLLRGWFIDHTDGSENDVGYVTSSDGVTFAFCGKVLLKGEWYDRLQASFPAVAQVDGTWHMLYEGKAAVEDINSVCWATSSDGTTWEKRGPAIRPDDDPSRLLMPGVPTPGADYADVDVGTPTLYHDGSRWHVWYHMTKREPWSVRIGYATGQRLDALTCQPTPFLDLIEAWESGTVGARSSVVKVGNWYYMAYEWATALPVTPERSPRFESSWWGTSILRSAYIDRGWKRWSGNPLLENPTLGFGYDGPELLVEGDRLYLYYRGENNTTWRVRLTF